MPSTSTPDLLLSLPNAEQLETGDFDLRDVIRKLIRALIDETQRREVLQLTGDSATGLIECLDTVVSSDTFRNNPNTLILSRVFSTISGLSCRCQYLPHSYWINPETITLPKEPHTSGTRAQVYRGTQNGKYVAVKVLRTSNKEDLVQLQKRFCGEAAVWKYMLSPHILEFNGAFYHNNVPAIVTPWMRRGNIAEYLEKHTDVDRLRLLSGAVKGIEYLHDRNIAHGGVKVTSILISDDTPPRSVLTDFGSACITITPMEIPNEEQGSPSFMAPELLLPTKYGLEKRVPSKQADIYAFGMTIYQILTGKQPFPVRRRARIVHAVISGERPAKPENMEEIGMTGVMWDLLGDCWREDRATRPDIAKVLTFWGIADSSGWYSPPARFNRPTERDLGVEKQDTGKRSRRYALDQANAMASIAMGFHSP